MRFCNFSHPFFLSTYGQVSVNYNCPSKFVSLAHENVATRNQ